MRTGISIGFITMLMFSCGTPSSDRKDKAPTPSSSPAPTNPLGVNQFLSSEIAVPVETILFGNKIPERLKADAMTLSYRSNIEGATFECRTAKADGFSACPEGDKFTFKELIHGQSYYFSVRAKAPNGALDGSPIEIAFLIDKQNGEPMTSVDSSGTAPEQPLTPQALPREETPPPTGTSEPQATGISREIQVGGFYAMIVPYDMHVASFSTTKTLNGDLHLLRIVGNRGRGTAYEGVSCDRPWETPLASIDDYDYCEGTPTKQQVITGYSNPMPFNHVELVRGNEAYSSEKILAAAFDGEQDPSEQKLGITTTCGNTRMRGEASIPVLNKYLGISPDRKLFQWCQVRSTNGTSWWIGYFGAYLATTSITTINNGSAANASNPSTRVSTPRQNPPRIKVIYSAQVMRGLETSRDFLVRAATMLPQVIVPLAPVATSP